MNEFSKLPATVDTDLVMLMEQYALETGEDPTLCLNEALSDWLEHAARPRLEQLRKRNRPMLSQMALAAL